MCFQMSVSYNLLDEDSSPDIELKLTPTVTKNIIQLLVCFRWGIHHWYYLAMTFIFITTLSGWVTQSSRLNIPSYTRRIMVNTIAFTKNYVPSCTINWPQFDSDSIKMTGCSMDAIVSFRPWTIIVWNHECVFDKKKNHTLLHISLI